MYPRIIPPYRFAEAMVQTYVRLYLEGSGAAVAVDGDGRTIAGPSTDHAAVWQEALDYLASRGGGTLIVGRGVYRFSHPVLLKARADDDLSAYGYAKQIVHSNIHVQGGGARIVANTDMDGIIIGRPRYTVIEGLRLDGNGKARHGVYTPDLPVWPSRSWFRHMVIENTVEEGWHTVGMKAFHMENVESQTGMYIDVTGDYVELHDCHSGSSNELKVMGSQVTIKGGVYRRISVIGTTELLEIDGVWVAEQGPYSELINIAANAWLVEIRNIFAKLYTNQSLIRLAGSTNAIRIENMRLYASDTSMVLHKDGGTLAGLMIIEHSRIYTRNGGGTLTVTDLTGRYGRTDYDILVKDTAIWHYGNFAWQTSGSTARIRAMNVLVLNNSDGTSEYYIDEWVSSVKLKAVKKVTITGDGSTKEFDLGAHYLNYNPSSDEIDKIDVTCVVDKAPSAYACYLVDSDGDGRLDHVHIVFASPPASGERITVVAHTRYKAVP